MKFRDVIIFTGTQFRVPRFIQRIDSRDTHGWQVRYGGTKLFSDHSNDGSGAQRALERATRDLARRIARLPARLPLQKQARECKSTDLPVGISGPIVRQNPDGSVLSYTFSVLLPRFGQRSRGVSVYIGARTTYSAERYRVALAKAVALRREAVAAYQRAANEARGELVQMLSESIAQPPGAAPTRKRAPRPGG
ncbi:MAG: hypothetical protein IT501_08410 [Rubrivivax sp.]|nr:hypothetical protein [Rubrivivax sp.]